jgi:hypothetical protein
MPSYGAAAGAESDLPGIRKDIPEDIYTAKRISVSEF